MQSVSKYDFTVVYLAEVVAAADKKFGEGSLAISLIREIGRTDQKDYVRDRAGADNVGRFLVELADRLHLVENQNVLKDEETRNGLCRIIGGIATKHQSISQTCASVLPSIHKYDFTIVYLAEAVAAAEKKFGDGSLEISLIREIGRTDQRDYVRDGAGGKRCDSKHSPVWSLVRARRRGAGEPG